MGLRDRHVAGFDLARLARSNGMYDQPHWRPMDDGQHFRPVRGELLCLPFTNARGDAVAERAHVDVVIRAAAAAVVRQQNTAAIPGEIAEKRASEPGNVLRRRAVDCRQIYVNAAVVARDQRLSVLRDVMDDEAACPRSKCVFRVAPGQIRTSCSRFPPAPP